jgi:hypothetical protein
MCSSESGCLTLNVEHKSPTFEKMSENIWTQTEEEIREYKVSRNKKLTVFVGYLLLLSVWNVRIYDRLEIWRGKMRNHK